MARNIYDKLVREKQAKGYTEGPDGTPYQTTDKEHRVSGVAALGGRERGAEQRDHRTLELTEPIVVAAPIDAVPKHPTGNKLRVVRSDESVLGSAPILRITEDAFIQNLG